MGAIKKLYDYISKHGLKSYSSQEFDLVTGVRSWARSMRTLRQNDVIIYNYDKSAREYEVTAINEFKSTTLRTSLSDKKKYSIRHRDGHRCQSCGKGANDGVLLHVDHKIPVDMGGNNEDSNLWTLCDRCNQGKKAYFKDDLDTEIMKTVFQEKSGYQKLKVLFELSPNMPYTPTVLQGISGIRDWTRTIRTIREKEKINIVYFKGDNSTPDFYSNIPE